MFSAINNTVTAHLLSKTCFYSLSDTQQH